MQKNPHVLFRYAQESFLFLVAPSRKEYNESKESFQGHLEIMMAARSGKEKTSSRWLKLEELV